MSGFSRIIPLQLLMKITGQQFVFPFYHLVSDKEVIHIKHLYTVRSEKQFEKDLDFLIAHYGITDIRNSLEAFISQNKTRQKGFILSFDDGLREVYDVVAPILLRKGLQAICFINTGFIDNVDMFFRYKASILIDHWRSKPLSTNRRKAVEKWALENKLQIDERGMFLLSVNYQSRSVLDDFAMLLDVDFNEYLKLHKPYLTASQIKSLSEKGFIMGAHSIDHPLFSAISSMEQKKQVKLSVDFIRQTFQSPLRLFSFPFTDDGLPESLFFELLDGEGTLADLTFGSAGLKHDVNGRNIQRIPMECGNHSAQNIIRGEYLYYMMKAAFNSNNILRK